MSISLLAAFPSPAQGVWHLGPVPLRAYALFIIAGIIAALVIGDRRWEARGGERGVIYDIALWAVPFGLVGGRLYHVLTDWPTYFGANGAGIGAAFRIWDGGLGIWGAVALGAVGAWIGCRRHGIPLPAFGDAIAPGIVLAQAIGRLGNYFNQELYGRPTDLPWGLEIFYRQDPSGIIDVHSLNGVSTGDVAYVVHPTFLYELLCNLVVFALLLYVDKRFKIGHGRLFALYVAGYCVGRFAVELMRDDFATQIAGIRINSFTATFVFIGAIVYFILAPKGREAPETLRGNGDYAATSGDDSPEPADAVEKELVTAAAGTGIVAAATVAAEEDDPVGEDTASGDTASGDQVADADADDVSESVADEPAVATDADDVEEAPEGEAPAADAEDVEAAPVEDEPVATDADDIEEAPEDEAIVEAQVVADGDVVVETAAEAEEAQLIDEDHDPVDEEDLENLDEGTAVVVEQGPVSEQQEDLDESDTEAVDEEQDVDEQAAAEEEAAEAEAAVLDDAEAETPVEVTGPEDEPDQQPADEAELEAEVTADSAVVTESATVAEDADLIDEDHDPVGEEDLESLDEGTAVVVEQGPVSEQQEELDEPDAKVDVDVDEQATAVEESADGEAAVEVPSESEAPASDSSASDYVVITTPPPASLQQGSRLGRLLRRRRN